MDAFDPHAPEPQAWQRERHLQALREQLTSEGGFDDPVAAVEWVVSLAAAGHVGAARLRDRACAHVPTVAQVRSRRPQLLASMPLQPSILLEAALGDAACDVQDVLRLLRAAGDRFAPHTWAVEQLVAAGCALEEEDRRALAAQVRGTRDSASWERVPTADHALIYAFARWRLLRGQPHLREQGRALAAVAAQAGSPAIWSVLWTSGLQEEAGDPAINPSLQQEARYAARWFAQGCPRVPEATRICFVVGDAFETGTAGAVRDLERAVSWYERGLPGVTARTEGRFTASFCDAVARGLDPQASGCVVQRPQTAEAWHERAIAAGSPKALYRWLKAHADPIHEADPTLVLAQVRRFDAACAPDEPARWMLMDAGRAAARLALTAAPDAQATWQEIARRLANVP